nr:hypothetical protein Itr_chr11CG03000 [Ipomoea trifida]
MVWSLSHPVRFNPPAGTSTNSSTIFPSRHATTSAAASTCIFLFNNPFLHARRLHLSRLPIQAINAVQHYEFDRCSGVEQLQKLSAIANSSPKLSFVKNHFCSLRIFLSIALS